MSYANTTRTLPVLGLPAQGRKSTTARLWAVLQGHRGRVFLQTSPVGGEILVGLTLTAEAARHPDSSLLQRVLDLGRAALAEMRALMQDLQTDDEQGPAGLDVGGVLTRYASALAGPEVRLSVDARYGTRAPTFDRELLRIGQEAINNAVRHARARHVWVSLSDADGVRLHVEDDGIGLPEAPPAHGRGIGLWSMEQRARAIGARFALSNRPGGGTVVEVHATTASE